MRILLLLTTSFLLVSNAASAQSWLKTARDRIGKNFKFRHVIWRQDVKPVESQAQEQEQKASQQQTAPRSQSYLPLVYRDTKSPTQATSTFSICSKKLFAVIKMNGSTPVVDFWSVTDPPTPSGTYSAPYRTSNNRGDISEGPCLGPDTPLGYTEVINAEGKTQIQDWRFELDLNRKLLGDQTKQVWVPFRTFTVGVSTIPIRIRARYEGTTDYKDRSSSGTVTQRLDTVSATATAQVNASLNAGFTWGRSYFTHRGINNYAFTVGPFIGLSSADLKKPQYVNPGDYKYDQVLPALSYGINAIVSRNNLGLVFSYGFDHAFGDTGDYWIYQHRPWFGVGVSTSMSFF
jgi:hypothetical protein